MYVCLIRGQNEDSKLQLEIQNARPTNTGGKRQVGPTTAYDDQNLANKRSHAAIIATAIHVHNRATAQPGWRAVINICACLL